MPKNWDSMAIGIFISGKILVKISTKKMTAKRELVIEQSARSYKIIFTIFLKIVNLLISGNLGLFVP